MHGDIQRLRKTPKGTALSEDAQKYKELELEEIESIQSDRHAYLAKVFHHLKKGRKFSLALFFDNLDRRTPDLQEQAFLKASRHSQGLGEPGVHMYQAEHLLSLTGNGCSRRDRTNYVHHWATRPVLGVEEKIRLRKGNC